jgi:hypothetical protein
VSGFERTILICGLPGSGNNLVRRFVERCAQKVGPRHARGVVFHGGPHHPSASWRCRGATHVVIPVRHPGCRRQSMYRRQLDWSRYPPVPCAASIFRIVVDDKLPVYLLSYEALVADPEGVGRDLAEFLELPYVPWPAAIDSEHPTEGAVFDANARHLQEA